METLIETIRTATVVDASAEARAAGAQACRTILTALDAQAGESFGSLPAANPVATIVAAMRGLPPDQLLDLAIARLRAALPTDPTPPAVTPLRFPLIPISPLI